MSRRTNTEEGEGEMKDYESSQRRRQDKQKNQLKNEMTDSQT